MVEIYITSEEISKYTYLIILFNSVFPQIMEGSGMIVNIEFAENNILRMPYEYFIHLYDNYGLNKVAE